jgi:release factor glutamine methyltransferase
VTVVASAPTVAAAQRTATERLRAAGVGSPALDARLLVAKALRATVEQVIMQSANSLPADAAGRLDALVARRAAREPMAQILGRREFWSREFAVTADTLTPRPESEEIIAAVLAAAPDRSGTYRMLDLGCGTGCLLLTLLAEYPRATGVGVDASEPALEVARRNAAALNVGDRALLVRGDWGDGLNGAFDVIVANPPYIVSADMVALDPEVRLYEPRLALDGGSDGLHAYRRLAPDMQRLLAPAGLAGVEVGAGQAADVAAIFASAGLGLRYVRRDLAGHERCLVITRLDQK